MWNADTSNPGLGDVLNLEHISLTFGSIISVSESLLNLNFDPEEPRLEHISSVNYCHRNPVNLFGFFEEIYLLNDTMEESDSGQQQKRCRCGFFG